MKFDISILIPYYNSVNYIDRFFSSIVSQKVEYLQIICIDDGSNDNSWEKIEEWKPQLPNKWELLNIKIVHKGQAAAVSAGLSKIKSDIFTWADIDDELLNEFFTKRLEFFKQNKDYSIVRNNVLVENSAFNKPNALLFNGEYATDSDNLFIKLFKNEISTTASGAYTIKTKDFFQIYPNKQIPFSEIGQNLQLILPMLSKHKCGFINSPLYKYIQRKDSHANSRRSINEIIDRINGIYELYLELIPYCSYNKEALNNIAEDYKRKETLYYLKKAAIANRKN